MAVIKQFPGKITSLISGYNDFLVFFRELEALRNSEVILDLRNTTWFEANLCAVLGSVIEHLENRGNTVKLINIKAPRDILSRNGFLKKFNIPKPPHSFNTEIDYRTFKEHQGKQFSEYVGREVLLNEDFPRVSKLLNKKINESIFELFENARTHGKCGNMHTCGQYYPSKSTLDFTIVDMGQTIKHNVNKFLKSNKSGAECIEWAMQDKNTTKTGNVSGGLGLAIIFNFIKLNKGKIQIVSSDGYWELRKGTVKKVNLKHSFPGTIANLEFNFSDTSKYYLKSEVDVNNIF